MATSKFFFGHGLLPLALYPPDFTTLQTAPTRVMVAGGSTSKGEVAQRTAVPLTQRLRTFLIDFPGGHDGLSASRRKLPSS